MSQLWSMILAGAAIGATVAGLGMGVVLLMQVMRKAGLVGANGDSGRNSGRNGTTAAALASFDLKLMLRDIDDLRRRVDLLERK